MSLSASLACPIVLIFALLGVTKILALGPMPELAADAGFTTAAYRMIGTLELAGAVGVALGPALPLYGGLAGAGLLILLTGAVTTHVRKRDGLPKLVPAVVCAALVAWYLVLLTDV
ncbi:DoxX-like protein [Streptomyces sp. Ag109_O5-1]|uniref:DoxX family protein n=1 Tax=Streptomyces sp. Ag109_O5-1 TaxID=1938851 RepID=UPI000F4DA7A4|nr:DoxX family protein [Streptomyces sp. Ag109_O5-1]RPE38532.1 DoxX-like protein [Streptomyces sp. Ag109_O5-1]